MKLKTDADLADILGVTITDVRRGCMLKGWPCVKPKRSVWRFTDEQVAQIVAMSTAGKKKTKATGQTKTSKARA
jgi:hypothetical protein